MKPLLKLIEQFKPIFDEGGVLGFGKPLFEAMENFFFAPSAVTRGGPHVRDPLDVKRVMTMVIIALFPCIACAIYFFGLRFIAMMIVSYVAGGIVEVAFAIVRKEPIAEGFFVTGMLFPLIMPPTMPLWMVALGVMFGVLVGKELFGGTGRNVFNPAIVGRCFLILAYPLAMAGNWVKPVDDYMGRTLQYVTADKVEAELEAEKEAAIAAGKPKEEVDAITNATPLKYVAEGPGGWEKLSVFEMFIGKIGGSFGETSTAAILAGGIFLLFTGVANWRSVVGTLGAAFAVAFALHMSNPERFAPPLMHMCAGGLMFGAFFMVTDPVSSPITNCGKWVYGIFIGIVVMLIRNFTGYVEGMLFAILIGNIFAPILDEIVFSMRIRRLANEG